MPDSKSAAIARGLWRRVEPKTIRATLGWLLAGIIAPLALATAALLVHHADADQAVTRQRLGAIAETLVQGVEAELERGQALLEVLAVSPQFLDGDLRALHDFARRAARKEAGTRVIVLDAQGQVVLSTASEWGAPLPNIWQLAQERRRVPWNGHSLPLTSGDMTRRALLENKVVYSDLYFAANISRPALALALPARSAGGQRFTFVLAMSPAVLQDRVRKSVTLPDVRVALVDRNGVVVASNAASVVQVGQPVPVSADRIAGPSGSFRTTGRDGADLEAVYARLPKNGFVVLVGQPAASFWKDAAGMTWFVVYALACAAGIALVYFFARRLTRPIAQLASDVAHSRAPQPECRLRIAELQVLARAARAAADSTRLRQEMEERKVGELRDRALFSEQMVGIVSHDLRNPLLVAHFAASSMADLGLPPEGEVHVGRLQWAIGRAQAMTRELLDFTRARIGSGIPVNMEPVDLHQSMTEHLGALQHAHPLREIAHEQVGQGACEADPGRLSQLTDNLVNNAIAYGAPGTPVTVRTIVADGFFRIEVHNKGTPIPAELGARIFEPMVRATTSRDVDVGGVGLGLYIVRQIVHAHAGDVSLASNEAGTTFTATFPR